MTTTRTKKAIYWTDTDGKRHKSYVWTVNRLAKENLSRPGETSATGLRYDYDRQCWVRHDIVLECGHPEKLPSCYACNHAGETL